MGGLNLPPRPPLAPARPWPRAGGDPVGTHTSPRASGLWQKHPQCQVQRRCLGAPEVQVRVGRDTITASQRHVPPHRRAHSSGTASRLHPASISRAETMHEQNQPVPELPPLKTAGKKDLKIAQDELIPPGHPPPPQPEATGLCPQMHLQNLT